MNWVRRLALGSSTGLLVAAAVLFAATSGILVRDFGAGVSSATNLVAEPGEGFEERTNLFQLTYEVAVFSTVEVQISIRAVYGTQRLDALSNGSILISFRPDLPGLYHFVVQNVANASGQIGYSLLLSGDVPPELESAMLNPLMYVSAILLLAAITLSLAARSIRRITEEEPL